MTTLEFKLMGLLARQPMSGYDLAKILNQDYIPFGSISHTQIYPALAKLTKKELVNFKVITQDDRPNKKIYNLTVKGKEMLKNWVESPSPIVNLNDEFFLKIFSSWLANPRIINERFQEQIKLHEERLLLYKNSLQSNNLVISDMPTDNKIIELGNLMYQSVIIMEKSYLEWLNLMSEYFEE